MGRRKRPKGDDPVKASRQRQWRDAIPLGVSLDDLGDLCRALRAEDLHFGCRDGEHALRAAREFICVTHMHDAQEEIVAWLALVGGVCDCTVESRVLRRVLRLSDEDRDEERRELYGEG